MSRGQPPQGATVAHDHSGPGEGGDTIDAGTLTTDDINLEDNDSLDWGTDEDVGASFDPAVGGSGAWVLEDQINTSTIWEALVGGGVRLRNRDHRLDNGQFYNGLTTGASEAQLLGITGSDVVLLGDVSGLNLVTEVQSNGTTVLSAQPAGHANFNNGDLRMNADGAAVEWGASQDAAMAYEATPDVLDLTGKDLRYSAVTGAPTFGNHDHSEAGMTTIPNAGLANDSITFNANDGLSGGGSVALGGSVGVAVAPGDFAGAGLTTSGSPADLDVGSDATIDVAANQVSVNEGNAFDWTSRHDFEAGLGLDDDDKIFFGTGDDMSVRYEPAEDELKWREEGTGDRMSLDNAGNLVIAGTLDETSSP